ncbi:MAG: phosphatase PAP2 family protein, partial [Thermoleophilia bacterium]|nr:phosphatase PAP2 family protein [Thermoleophilia bacterium]
GLCFVSRRAGILGLALALLIAFSRVFVGEHYVSDVAAGALIGAAATLLVNSQKKPLRHLLEPLLRLARRIHLA